jgi:3-methyladenine DNA glycosylase AlkD
MAMEPILEAVVHDLADQSDAATRESSSRFFREPVRSRGVKTAAVRAVARKHWKEVEPLGKARILALCEGLYRTGYLEDGFVAADWAARLAPAFEPGDIGVLGAWVDRYIDNWAACDTLCNHAVGDLVARYPETVEVLKEWAGSGNRWMRRAAAVSLVVPAKRGEFLEDALAIADLLLLDADDMVRKGYGWLLKEASRRHRDEVHAFVLARRDVMPRTALRYAVELMPPELRAEAMRREKKG